MPVSNDESPVLNEETWNAWLAKSKLREQRTAYRMRLWGGIAVSLFALGAAWYSMT